MEVRKKIRHEVFKKKAKWMIQKNDDPIELTIPEKSQKNWNVAFLTTAGVHLKTDPVFQVEDGDYSLRLIPKEATQDDLMISHTHYDTSDAEKDINCVFPLEHLRYMERNGEINSLSSVHVGMMGYIPDTKALVDITVPKIIDILHKENTDVLLLSPG